MRTLALTVAMLALFAASCGGDEAAERILEGQEGVGDVEIDSDDGEIQMEIQDEDGDTSVVIGGGEIPADFPIPIPDGGDVIQTVDVGGGNQSLTLEYPESDLDSIVAFYESWVEDSSVTVQAKSEVAEPKVVQWTLEANSLFYSVTVTEGFGTTVVSLVVTGN